MRVVAVVVLTGAVLVACGGGGAKSGPPADPTHPVISGYAFSPNPVAVKAGTTVTWTNHDPTTHTVTSDTKAFGSPRLGTSHTYSFTFASPGTYKYHCSIHTYMKGTVVVT